MTKRILFCCCCNLKVRFSIGKGNKCQVYFKVLLICLILGSVENTVYFYIWMLTPKTNLTALSFTNGVLWLRRNWKFWGPTWDHSAKGDLERWLKEVSLSSLLLHVASGLGDTSPEESILSQLGQVIICFKKKMAGTINWYSVNHTATFRLRK